MAKGDYTTARKLARELESEASGDESMDVKAYVNGVLLLIADKRRSEAYAPIRQAVSLPEARAILERLSQPLDPSAKEELYFQLQSSRLPDEILPEVLAHLQDKIKESGDNRRYLGLLNSFVCPESEVALLGFVGSSYDRSVRVQALGLLSQRPYSDGRAALLSKILSSEADDEVRANLMMQLSDSPQAQLREVVRGALGDSSDKVRAVAVGTLDPAADEDRKKLLQVAQGDGSGEVRVSALHRLAKGLSQPATLNMVLLAAENDPADPVRVEAIRILGRSAPEQLPMVQPTLERLAAGNVSEEVGNMAKAVLVRLTRH